MGLADVGGSSSISIVHAGVLLSRYSVLFRGSTVANNLSIEIVEAKTSNVARRAFAIRVTRPDGSPAAGETLEITLDGPGSLAYAFSAKDQRREADTNGTIKIDWYRKGIFDRDIKATVTVATKLDGANVSYEEVDPDTANTSYNLPTKPLRI